jgi:hypothetical protein
MKEITHDQARRFIRAATDGLLDDAQTAELRRHLRSCEVCRAEVDRFDALQRDLRTTFHERWDAVPLPGAPLVTELPIAEPLWPRLGRGAVNLSLLALWGWLYWAVFGYFRIIFSNEDFRTNQIILLIVFGLFIFQFRQERWQLRLDVLPQIFWPGLSLVLVGSILYLLA